jgi:hypothetical protein
VTRRERRWQEPERAARAARAPRGVGRGWVAGSAAATILRLRETAGNAAVASMLATVPVAAVQRQAARVTYPGYHSVVNSMLRPDMWDAWKETVNATTTTSRREQGFWIQWNVKSVANANGRYRVRGRAVSPAVANTQDASMNSAPKPADDGDWHTVAHFHTHTPTRYRTTDASGVAFTSRPAGATGADNVGHTSANVTGIVRDYVGTDGQVPAGHPLWAESTYYRAGPLRRA